MDSWVLVVFFITNAGGGSGMTSIPNLTKEQCERMRDDFVARAPKELHIRVKSDASAMCLNKSSS
jgi:hypothetical protein